MDAAVRRHIDDLGRGIIGALIFAAPFLYTMETWWLGWRLPGEYLLVYALVGIGLVVVLVRVSGIREAERKHPTPLRHVVTDSTELVLESFVAAFIVLGMFGILESGNPAHVVARLGLIQMVPLALGAAIANRVLAGAQETGGATELPFPQDLALFAVGALFVALPIVPTEEMPMMAAHAGWWRLATTIVVTLLIAYLVLFELEFRGQTGRRRGLTPALQLGETFLVYAVALTVSAVLLVAFGHFRGMPPEVWAQEAIVLGFLATIGGSAARVIF